jgi:hypothetical protein
MPVDVLRIHVRLGEHRLQCNQDRAAQRRGALRQQAIDRLRQFLAAARGRLHERRHARELDDADPGAGRLLGDECLRRRLRRGKPVGLHVARAHAAGDIDRQNHRVMVRRQCKDRRRPGHREKHRADCDEQKQRRQVPTQRAAAHGFLDEGDARVAHGRLLPPPEDRAVRDDEER